MIWLPTTIEQLLARVFGDLENQSLKRPEHDVDAGLDVAIVAAEFSDRGLGAQKRNAAPRHDAFFNSCLRAVHRVFDAILLFLDLDLSRTADADNRDAARELRQTLLQLLLVVVRGRFLDLRLDLANAALDVLLLARAVDDRGVFLLGCARAWLCRASAGSRSRA